MTGDVRPGADEPGVLEQLGFNVPSPTPQAPAQGHLPPHARAAAATPAASTRREAREIERGASASSSRKPAKSAKPGKSAERRIRAVQKSYGKPKGRRGSTVIVPTGSTRPPTTTTRSSSRARTIGSRVLSVAAMVFAGALAVGMSVPANAFGNGSDAQSMLATGGAAQKVDGQTLAVASDAATSSSARDEYTVTSWADMLRLQYGTRDYSYEMGDPNGPIRWPFPYPVPISSGFGERNAPCRGCSSMHMGVDFTPGGGAPIYAIASGTVTTHDDDAGGFGNHVIIDHGDLLGNGSDIETLYAHMQHGSVALKVGDHIEVGDFIGLVGMTGTATGNHLHFEVHVNGVQIDPFAWLQKNT
ncbi:MAG: family metallopeptidase [Schumannella sp.]|nr:family metallopeptidase [Schumannella sp.]